MKTELVKFIDWSDSRDFVKDHLLPILKEYNASFRPEYVANVLEVYLVATDVLIAEILVNHHDKTIKIYRKIMEAKVV